MTTSSLFVPDVTGMDTLTAGLAYARGGWYQGPTDSSDIKNPGSVLGRGWQHQTSRDPDQIVAWHAGTSYGLFLHAGRSGAVMFDIDHPEEIPPVLMQAIGDLKPPFQSTRPDTLGRGHVIFTCPPGRMFSNSTGKLGKTWGEVRGANGVIIAAPTPHPDDGCYQWMQTGPVPELPPELADMLTDAQASEDAATDEAVAAFIAEHTSSTRPKLLSGPVRRVKAADRGSRHVAAVESAIWAAKEARAGYYPAGPALAAIGEAFRQSLNGDAGRNAKDEYASIVAWAVGQAKAADLDEVRRIAERNDAVTFTPDRTPLGQLGAFVTQLREWLELPDPAHILLTLAAAATRDLDGEPVWLLLVAVPSSGKTETVRLLDKRADGRLNEVTAAGLLGWSKGKEARPSGVLSRVGDKGLITFGDLSSLLATSDSGGRDNLFGLLRRAYDGHATRDISPPGKPAPGFSDQLSWTGRLTVVAAVTGAIDRYSAHADQLGPRWLYTRIADPDIAARRRAAVRARRSGLEEYRDAAKKAADQLILAATKAIPDDVPDDIFQVISDSAIVTCWGRAAVPRHGYGRREIDGMPVIEAPPRLVSQLCALGRGLLAFGLPVNYAAGLLRSAALDSMPADRRAVLAILAEGSCPSTAELARRAGLDRKVTRMRSEELEAIGIVEGIRDPADEDSDDDHGKRPVRWQLGREHAQLISDVFVKDALRMRWDEIMSAPTHPPLTKTVNDQENGHLEVGNHNFVPPTAAAFHPAFAQPGQP